MTSKKTTGAAGGSGGGPRDAGSPKDSHYARLRRAYRDTKADDGGQKRDAPRKRKEGAGPPLPPDRVYLYGLHTVRAALDNPARTILSMRVTRNALARLEVEDTASLPFPVEMVAPGAIDDLLGDDAIHQGVVVEANALPLRRLADLKDSPLLLVLDQVTDPHNVGAIMRSAVAFGAGAVITTQRHSPTESGVMAKSASGALELIPYIQITNLADAIGELQALGFLTLGLDSEADGPLEAKLVGERIALVLGAEGKGLRQKTRETVDGLVRLDMPGAIKSLNVSNAAAIALYAAHRHLQAS
ncbi:23S rRNA (guanosine(2251)-2'-O)-methyltransferase RlmB [Georhizobium profundi]|uniref:23S rRNA (Guanosine(2251)-2'-O)-methyltransferase RlmB n=1 Tax=Georhizobium profundi TaxID=2341112 RepID=A0A3S9B4J9_9HYPH|nr:23S rRNA (guanosine(2251)-2'-O)-methyltransferase RlmB [Georhizobium profundi]AZN71888.1 23S rRNA (guanosine(2251)-2'-O)-methyltransferase RlmB [Georhizobium profundi]